MNELLSLLEAWAKIGKQIAFPQQPAPSALLESKIVQAPCCQHCNSSIITTENILGSIPKPLCCNSIYLLLQVLTLWLPSLSCPFCIHFIWGKKHLLPRDTDTWSGPFAPLNGENNIQRWLQLAVIHLLPSAQKIRYAFSYNACLTAVVHHSTLYSGCQHACVCVHSLHSPRRDWSPCTWLLGC